MKMPEALTGTKYIVWIETEKADYNADTYENCIDPEEIGRFESVEEAIKAMTLAEHAPEMLQALEHAAEVLECNCTDDGCTGTCSKGIMQQAIAKAKGEE